MKKIKYFWSGLIFLCAPPLLAYDSFDELMRDQAKKSIEAIAEYLSSHPKAPDREEALAHLSENFLALENYKKTLDILEEIYTARKKEKSEDHLNINDILQQYIMVAQLGGYRERGKMFLEKVKKNYNGGPDSFMMSRVFQQLELILKNPATGERLEIDFIPVGGKEKLKLEEYKGKIVLVDFWATWCGPCLRELPGLKKIYRKYHKKGFEILGISLDENEKKLEAFLKSEKIPWPQCLDKKKEHGFSEKYGILGIPTTFLVGKDGKIIASNLNAEALEEQLEKLFKTP